MLDEQDRAALSVLFGAGLAAGSVERMSVRLVGTTAQKARLLELTFVGVPNTSLLVVASRDVTTERSREELRRQKAAAERASLAKSEFMSQVSHELRAPLNAILGFAQLMAIDTALSPLPAVHRQRLQLIQHSGRRLLALIDQLLQLGCAEHRRQHLNLRDLPVVPLVKRCLDSLEPMALERNVRFELHVRDEDATVRADEQVLEQILTNLLTNAIKYNRSGGLVRVRIRSDLDVAMTFDDTGHGMSEAQLGHLFEPFNRLSASHSRIQGTGLGLVITKQLIEALGGKLGVWSQVGKGSRFRVRLPLGDAGLAVVPDEGSDTLPAPWDSGLRFRILYVEDDEINVLLMRELFNTQPEWQLCVMGTAAEAIASAKEHPPDLILVDMNLPDADGLHVLHELKADPRTREIRCIAVSADAVPRHVSDALQAGFADYWTKPLDLVRTVDRIKDALS